MVTKINEVFYGILYGKTSACADSVYQALFSPYEREPGDEAKYDGPPMTSCTLLVFGRNSESDSSYCVYKQ